MRAPPRNLDIFSAKQKKQLTSDSFELFRKRPALHSKGIPFF